MADIVIPAEFRWPLQGGALAGCQATLHVGPVPFLDLVDHTVPKAEPCEAGCGARVGISDLSGENLREVLPDLGDLLLPTGLWEEPHSALSDDGKPVHAVVFHDVDRCRERRGLPPLDVT